MIKIHGKTKIKHAQFTKPLGESAPVLYPLRWITEPFLGNHNTDNYINVPLKATEQPPIGLSSIELASNEDITYTILKSDLPNTLMFDNGIITGSHSLKNSSYNITVRATSNTSGEHIDKIFNIKFGCGNKLLESGFNNHGQIGINSDNSDVINNPTEINSDIDWFKVASKGNHNIAIKTSGSLWGWGDNEFGQTGINITQNKIILPEEIVIDTTPFTPPTPPTSNITWITNNLPRALIYTGYTTILSATNLDNSNITYSTTNTLPLGLTLSSNGTISGIPTKIGMTEFTISATDNNDTLSKTFTLETYKNPTWETPEKLPDIEYNIFYSQELKATSDGMNINYSFQSGTLPTGITYNSTTSILSGTTTSSFGKTYNFTIKATNTIGDYSTKSFSLTINNTNIFAVTSTSSPYLTLYKRTDDILTKLPNPDILPTGQGQSVTISRNGIYTVITHENSPYITIYKRDTSTNNLIKLPNPETLPTGVGLSATFSTNNNYLIIGHENYPFITIYKRLNDTFTKIPYPTDLPPSAVYGMSYSNGHLAICYENIPHITIYKHENNLFTKISNPEILPTDLCWDISFSPTGNYLAVVQASEPYINIYNFNSETNIFTKLENPAELPTGTGYGVSFSSYNGYMAVAHANYPFITIYNYTSGTFTKISNPNILPNGTCYDVSFTTNSEYLTVSHETNPFIHIYKISNNTFTKLDNPNILPTSTALSVSNWGGSYAQRPDPVWVTPSGNIFTAPSKSVIRINVLATCSDNRIVYYRIIGGSLPNGPGIMFDTTNGYIFGIAPRLATHVDEVFTFTVGAYTNPGMMVTREFSITITNTFPIWNGFINMNSPQPTLIESYELGDFNENTDINVRFIATDPKNRPLKFKSLWDVSTLPGTLSLTKTSSYMVLSGNTGISNLNTNYTLKLRAYSVDDQYQTQLFYFKIKNITNSPPVWITNEGLLIEYNYGITIDPIYIYASDPNNDDLTFSIIDGGLPIGLSMAKDGNSVKISGTTVSLLQSSLGGTSIFTLQANDGRGGTADRTFSINIESRPNPEWITPSGHFKTLNSGEGVSEELLASVSDNGTIHFAVTNGELPFGLVLSTDGHITGRAIYPITRTDTDYTFTIGISTTNEVITREFTITVLYNNPQWSMNTDLGSFNEQTDINLTFSATDPHSLPLHYALDITTTLPGTLTLNSSGTLSGNTGIVTQDVNKAMTIIASNETGAISKCTFTYKLLNSINEPPVWSTASGALGIYPNDYPMTNPITLQATDPNGDDINYSIINGSLSPGLLFSSLGMIYGITDSTIGGSYNFTVKATDIHGANSNKSFNIIINSPPIWNTPSGFIGCFDNDINITPIILDAIDINDNAFVYSIASGTLPIGLTLSTDGIISGTTPDSSHRGVSTFILRITDLYNQYTDREFSININTPPIWNTPGGALGNFLNNITITPITLSATDVSDGTITYSLIDGEMPPGLTFTNGVISGTTTDVSYSGVSNFTVRATSSNFSAYSDNSFVIMVNTPPVWTTNASLGSFDNSTQISINLIATDVNDDIITYSMINGSLPPGLTLNSTNNILSGITPNITDGGLYNFTIRASDVFLTKNAIPSYTDRVFSISTPCTPIWVTQSNLGNITAGNSHTINLLATDKSGGTFTYSLSSGTLPDGMTFSGNTITGTPTNPSNSYEFTITATNIYTAIDRTFTVNITNQSPSWNTSGTLPSANTWDVYSTTLSATDPNNDTISYTVTTGSLPSGLTLNSSTGVLSGTPTVGGNLSFSVTASDNFGGATEQPFTINITIEYPTWNTNAGNLTTIEQLSSYSHQLSSNYTNSFSLYNSTLPNGLTLSTSGLISGTLTDNITDDTTYNFTVKITNNYGNSTRDFNIIVSCLYPTWTTNNSAIINELSSVSIQLDAKRTTTYSLKDYSSFENMNEKLSGITLNPSTGLISGTLTSTSLVSPSENFSFVLRASNSAFYKDQNFTLTVMYMRVIWNSSSSLGSVNDLANVSIQLNATHATDFSLKSGSSLPSGLTLNSSGLISGTLTSSVTIDTTYNFTITASNSYNNVDRTFNLTVIAANQSFLLSSIGGLNKAFSTTNGSDWYQKTFISTPFSSGDVYASSYNGSIFCAIAYGTSLCAISSDGLNWTQKTIVSNDWKAMTNNGTTFCAITLNNALSATSTDGINWAYGTLPSYIKWTSIVWNGNVYCAIAGYNNSYTISAISSNGINWTQKTLPASVTWTSITNKGTIFCAVATSSSITATSSDGILWTQGILPASTNWSSITNNGNIFCAVSYNSTIAAISSNGIEWTQKTLPASANWQMIGWNGNIFCAVAYSSAIAAISLDGTTWTQKTLPVSANWYSITTNGTTFCVCANSYSLTSSDGINWKVSRDYSWKGITSTSSKYCAYGTSITASTSDLITWQTSNSTWSNVASNGTIFCGINTNENYGTSSDGINWTSRTLPTAVTVKNISCNGSVFTIFASSSLYFTSSDGINWTQRSFNLLPKLNWYSIVYNGSKFCTIANNSSVSSISSDGINWTQGTLPTSTNWYDVAWNGSKFCAISKNSSFCATSTDGINWSNNNIGNPTPLSKNWYVIVNNGSIFCAIDKTTTSAVSSDGINWIQGTIPVSAAWYDMVWNGSIFCAVSDSSTNAIISSDGINWTRKTLPSNSYWEGIAWNGNIFCATQWNGSNVAISSDGNTWTQKSIIFGGWVPITNNGTTFCTLTYNGTLSAISTNGIDWTYGTLPIAKWFSVVWNGNIYCAIPGYNSSYNFVAISTNGIDWTQITLPISATWYRLAWNGSIFCTVGTGSTIALTSPDGVNWVVRTLPVSATWNSITTKGSTFYIVGNSSYVISTSDGINWNTNYVTVQVATNAAWQTITNKGTTFCALTSDSISAISTDGILWTQRTLPISANWQSIKYNGSIFCAVGYNNSVAVTSSDGLTWAQQTINTTKYYWQKMAWNGSIFCAIAYGSIAATSSDGTAWTLQTLPVNNNWLTIGWNGSVLCVTPDGYSNKYCISNNGISWTQKTLPFTADWYAIAAKETTFCIVANNNSSTSITTSDFITWTYHDMNVSNVTNYSNISGALTTNGILYTSSNGINWSTPIGLPTGLNSSIVYNGNVWVISGNTSNNVIATSTDTLTWTQQTIYTPLSYVNWNSITTNGSIFCTVAYNTSIYAISSDGLNWSSRTLPVSANWQSISWNGSIFCAVAYSSTIAITSSDAITWSQGTLPVSANWYSITNNGTNFYTVAKGSTIAATSSDGILWTQRTLPRSADWISINWNGSKYCINSWSPAYSAISNNGVSWTEHTMPIGGYSSIAWNGSVYCYGGYDTTSGCISNDGLNWTQITLPFRSIWNGLAWNGSVFCGIVWNSMVAISSDGITWTQINIPYSAQWQSITAKGSLFCAIAYRGDIAPGGATISMTSTDGINWSTSQYYAWNFGAINDKIIGSATGSIITINSTNGIIWTQKTLPTTTKTGWNISSNISPPK